MSEITIHGKLTVIQSKLKAPKGQRNKFGNYNYRSCEDIVEAVKPLLSEQGVSLVMNDDIVLIGERYYVKATVTLTDESGYIESSAFARESFNKKGMDDSQITGAASSYARKYALNGMFAIDDTKDADTQDNTESVKPEDYVIPFGKKFKGRSLSDISKSEGVGELANFRDWLARKAHEDNKPLVGDAKNVVENITKLLNG
jgi:hypothetical protein